MVPIQNETNILQSAKIKDYNQNGRPLGGFGWPKSHFRIEASPLSVIPTKKIASLLKWNMPKITLKVPLGQPTLNQKKLS